MFIDHAILYGHISASQGLLTQELPYVVRHNSDNRSYGSKTEGETEWCTGTLLYSEKKKTLFLLPLSADLLDKQPLSGLKGFILCTTTEILMSSKSSPESPTL